MHYLAAMSKLSTKKKKKKKIPNINHFKQTSKLHLWFDCIFFSLSPRHHFIKTEHSFSCINK